MTVFQKEVNTLGKNGEKYKGKFWSIIAWIVSCPRDTFLKFVLRAMKSSLAVVGRLYERVALEGAEGYLRVFCLLFVVCKKEENRCCFSQKRQ